MDNSQYYLIAYSGGLDSHVLLHQMATFQSEDPTLKLRAIHVHHGLNEKADDWVVHCEKVCAELKIPFILKKVTLTKKNGDSVEALAREARYAVIAECLETDEVLLTAHTLDDQAETLLLQLLRGAGPKGMSAMPMQKSFANSVLVRPLLNSTRESLQAYADKHQLHWVEDDSNDDLRFDRNYLRHRVMPILKERWPAALKNLSRSATHCASVSKLADMMAEQDLHFLQGSNKETLSVPALLELSKLRRDNALRCWFRLKGCLLPSTKQLEQCEKDILQASEDATPLLEIGDKQLRRYQNDLYLLPKLESFDRAVQLRWDMQSNLKLPGNLGELEPDSKYRQYDHVTIRFRQGGERIKRSDQAHSQTLKHFFQAENIPPWERDRIPLLYSEDCLVEVLILSSRS